MLRAFVATLALAFSVSAAAQEFPSRTVRIVVPYPPGGQMDLNARFIANKLSQSFGKPVVVENKPGAQSIVGAQDVARSAPDGHSIMFTNGATNTVVPHLFTQVPFNAVEDFTPITQIARTGSVLLAPASAPFSTLQEMVAYARANPGKLNFGSISASSQVQGELTKRGAGIDIVYVPYKGTADSVKALMADEIQLLWDSAFSAIGLLKSKRVKALAVTGPSRFPELPDVPTASELGIKGLETLGWIGFFGPKGLPPAVLKRLNEELVRVVNSPDFREVLVSAANVPAGTSPEEFAAIVRRDYAFWGEEIRKAGIKPQ